MSVLVVLYPKFENFGIIHFLVMLWANRWLENGRG